jgi:monofunctional biosynthetic peptidoglycan transglycosylase
MRWLDATLRVGTRVFIAGLLAALVLVWAFPPTGPVVALRAIVSWLFLTVLPVFLLGWLNPPATAYMLQARGLLRRAGKDTTLQHFWVAYEHVAPAVSLAVVAAEDPTFAWHEGFCWGRIYQVWRADRAGKPLYGVSTISQQLAKNLFLWPSRTYVRKGMEAYFVLLMEAVLSKQRILEIYLNVVQFDEQVFGVGAAAKHLSGKGAAELTAEEAALLASVLPNPWALDIREPSESLRRRAGAVLDKMEALGPEGLGVPGPEAS